LKFFKAVATYILAFVACMFLIATALKSWSGGMQAIFAFGMPGLITWWRAKTISRTTEGEMAHRLSQGNVMSTDALHESNDRRPNGQRAAAIMACRVYRLRLSSRHLLCIAVLQTGLDTEG
jgi:hypothetical protein